VGAQATNVEMAVNLMRALVRPTKSQPFLAQVSTVTARCAELTKITVARIGVPGDTLVRWSDRRTVIREAFNLAVAAAETTPVPATAMHSANTTVPIVRLVMGRRYR